MSGWLSLMLMVAIAGREAARELNVFQIMEIRSALGLVMLYPLIRLAGGFTALRTSRLRLHAGRGLLHYAAQLGWFYALTLIPLGQVVSLEFTMPIWTAILAASFLGERMTIWKISAIALGLIGVFVIVRPAAGEINPGQLIALAAAVGFGTSVAIMKSLTRTETTVAIVFWMMAVQVVAGALPTLYVWVWPSPYIWACATAVAIGHLFTLLHGARDAVCGCHGRVADGFPPRALDRRRRLADLHRADGRFYRAGGDAHSDRQSVEPETTGATAHAG
jgi:drug/metabolite transporter (DMT)-like permease